MVVTRPPKLNPLDETYVFTMILDQGITSHGRCSCIAADVEVGTCCFRSGLVVLPRECSNHSGAWNHRPLDRSSREGWCKCSMTRICLSAIKVGLVWFVVVMTCHKLKIFWQNLPQFVTACSMDVSNMFRRPS